MAFFRSSVPKYYYNHAAERHPFMTCIVRVNTQSQWQRTVSKVLDKCIGVRSFRMDDNGVVEISGCVDPSTLLKMLGKAGRSAELCWLQFGQCSSNLFMQSSPGESSYRDGRFLQATNLSRPQIPSRQALSNPNYAGYHDHDNQYYSYGNEHGYYNNSIDCYENSTDHHDDQYYSHGNEHGYYGGYPQSSYHQQSTYDRQYDQSAYNSHGRNQIQTRSAYPSRVGEDIGCCTIM